MREKILIADDEECIRYTFSDFLAGAGFLTQTAGTLSECIKKMQENRFDLLFLDICLGLDNGIEAIEGLKVLQPNCKIIIITGSLDSKAIARARRFGAEDYVVKPIHEASLKFIVEKTLRNEKKAQERHTHNSGRVQSIMSQDYPVAK